MSKYNPLKIEKKWQKYWESKKFYITKDKAANKENSYILVEFPYPSGDLHIGHWYAFSVPDIAVRYWRMKGKNVMYPTGFDAFGLPAENAAIKNNLQPEDWTRKNIAFMTKQLKSMGAAFDWSRVVSTIDPDYYRWTQWIFLQFYKKGLAYRAKTSVNWCPNDKTVLANEQVIDGCCDRCGAEVVQKEMSQWMYKITEYADKLVDGLEKLDWPEVTKTAQRNWIGRSEGAIIKFEIRNSKFEISVFTTRPDTLFGATYIVLAPEHPLIGNLESGILNLEEVKKYIEQASHKTELQRKEEEKEKTGVELRGIKAINPATGEEISVWTADYVLMGYGTGAIMAVPAHDQRDFEFAQKFKLPNKQVIAPHLIDHKNPPRDGKKNAPRTVVQGVVKHWEKDEFIQIVWKEFPWRTFVIGGADEGENVEFAVRREIKEETGYTNLRSIRRITPEIRSEWYAEHKDENRYARMNIFEVELGGPEREEISDEEKNKHEVVWVPRSAISSFVPVGELDFIVAGLNEPDKAYVGEGIVINSGKFSEMPSEKAKWEIAKFAGGKEKINYKLHDWVLSRQRYWGTPIPMIRCDKCAYQAVPEKDLPVKLPKLKNYKPSTDGRSPLAKAKEWLKVKCPNCGGEAERETDTMDTFVDSSWYFLRYTDPKNKKVFADKNKMSQWLPVDLYIGGAEHNTMHLLYSRFFTKAMHELGLVDFSEPFETRRNHGIILGPDGQKMSKSRGNVINPDDLVKKYGADAVRMYLAFMGPYEQGGPWNPGGITGVYRFLNRVRNLYSQIPNSKFQITNKSKIPNSKQLETSLHKAIKKIGEDIENLHFNTAVSELMKLLNEFERHAYSYSLLTTRYSLFLQLLAPFAPHLSEEIWQNVLKNKKSIHLEKWPEYDPKLIVEESAKIVVQINGKTRAVLGLPVDSNEATVSEMVQNDEKIKKYLADANIKKIIFVKNRLINFVF